LQQKYSQTLRFFRVAEALSMGEQARAGQHVHVLLRINDAYHDVNGTILRVQPPHDGQHMIDVSLDIPGRSMIRSLHASYVMPGYASSSASKLPAANSTTSIASWGGCRRFIYVHIPKTGGTTIGSSWRTDIPFNRDDARIAMIARLRRECDACGDSHEVTAEAQRRQFGYKAWDASVRFATVRNPYDLLLSMFFYSRGKCERHEAEASGFGEDCPYLLPNESHDLHRVDTRLSTIEQRRHFASWLEHHDVVARAAGWSGNGTSVDVRVGTRQAHSRFLWPHHIARALEPYQKPTCQRSWLTDVDGSEMLVRAVRMEDDEAFRGYSTPGGLLDLMCTRRPPHRPPEEPAIQNFSPEHGRRASFYTPRLCAIVATWFAQDFDEFGYDVNDCA
jgi:hypothetical protein